MRRKLAVAVMAMSLAGSASAFSPYLLTGISWFVQYVGIPVSYALSCGLSYSPPLRMFGTEENVYGIDWGSMACHAENVYGMQLALCGGAVERRMCGLQLGVLASGYASSELPFGDLHSFNVDYCRLYGMQFGTFAAKMAMVNGFQLSAIYCDATVVNGVQVGLVNATSMLHGLQIGAFNSASGGSGLQIGLINCTSSGMVGWLPVFNLVW